MLKYAAFELPLTISAVWFAELARRLLSAEDMHQLPEGLPLLMLLLLHNLLPDCKYNQAHAAVQRTSRTSRQADLQPLLHGIALVLTSSDDLQVIDIMSSLEN